MVEEDVAPQPHVQGARYCLAFDLVVAVGLLSMRGHRSGAGGVGVG